ncbi:ShlB/FhaC/HecB family hemolysin secretion/activation protein [Pseudanabaena cinerea]|nr:ShlB/FhaC/HecB family hemolysin secretion/activation protein [Pseudanabaena cinerea]
MAFSGNYWAVRCVTFGAMGAIAMGITLESTYGETLSPKQAEPKQLNHKDDDPCKGNRPLNRPQFPLRTTSSVLQEKLRKLEKDFFRTPSPKTCQAELQKLTDAVTETYVNNGYINSFATLDDTVDPPEIKINEGELEKLGADTTIEGLQNVSRDYVLPRIQQYITSPFNASRLEEGLVIMNRDPNFKEFRGTISTSKDSSRKPELVLDVKERNQFQGFVSFDNESPVSVGSERIGAGLSVSNLTNFGDQLAFSYYRSTSNGLNQYDISYSIPVNHQDGRLSFRVAPNNFRITQSDFAALGIRGAGTLYEVNFRQPIARSRVDEFALSLGYAYQTGQTFLFNDLQTPFGIGPESDGSTRTGVIKFGQEYTLREPNNSAWSFRSQFNLGTGLGIFNVSSNKVNNPNAPTSHFLSWSGQIQRLQGLGRNVFLLASLDTQLASDPLLSSQQFAIGGAQSVRGFRQNVRVGDNGFRLSLENRWVLLRDEIDESSKLQFGPFVDLGAIWNHPRNPNQLPQQNFIAGGGLVAILEPLKGLTMRLDYAIPFLRLSDKTNNLQDSSLYFNMKYQF